MDSNKNIKPVAKGTPQKKSKVKEVFDLDNINDVGKEVFKSSIVPGIKRLVEDAGRRALQSWLWKGGVGSDSSSVETPSYKRYYDTPINEAKTTRKHSGYEILSYDTKGKAISVLVSMKDIIYRFKVVNVLEYYELSDYSTDDYSLAHYGWTDLSTVREDDIKLNSKGRWEIRLPKAILLNNR